MKIVLFAGGVGSRLWPLSRKNAPKQFGKIIADRSMVQIAVHKLFPEFNWKDIYISTGKQYASLISEQLPELPTDNVIVEPEMRDVGPAVGLVVAQMVKINPDEPLVLLWGSDHLVKKEALFRKMLRTAEKLIQRDPNRIVFIGQKPRFANQNLGYIEFGKQTEIIDNLPIHEFTSFQYRPPLEKAQEWLNDGKHAWNLGYFATTPRFLWKLFEEFSPELYTKLKKIQDVFGTTDYEKVLAEVYPTLEKISFDNAILEKIDPKVGLVISADIEWSDIGAWEALKEALSDKVEANVTKGKILLEDCRDSILHNETKQLIVGIDLEGLVVVSMDDVILICPKDSVPKIKKFVQSLNGTDYEHLA
ncbi:MAG TPA: sugar phosphate nucleotidyltransferase [Candidatus Sulfotelmatobacter sp.]|jgi:mannose-1-phosphate guanylyltransferase|nr:sugar phosphate nucleotidyltransferase [Candidatus Sulfotelmatobacter sp.]